MSKVGKTPYSTLPPHCFWSRTHRGVAPQDVDPVIKGAFTLTEDMKIATAGSCFAQHLAKHLQKSGYNYFITERAHPIIKESVAASFNYGTFSARYGNLYTVRQLLQTFQRAYGLFDPQETIWDEGDHFIDPFRPNIQPGGFTRRDDFYADRHAHFAAIRRIMEECDVFIFTLGLTEAWRSKVDGAVFPLCPGVAGGKFDPNAHEFINFTVDEIVTDFMAFAAMLNEKNPKARIILTVSPVPLMATAREDQSVITATCYSKSVLRVACEMLVQRLHNAVYFPSYEVITGNFNRGSYYAEDLREVLPEGVSHVMRLFMHHYTVNSTSQKIRRPSASKPDSGMAFSDLVQRELDVICDEELLDRKS